MQTVIIEILNKNIQHILLITGVIYLLSFMIQIAYYTIYSKALKSKNNSENKKFPVSVVICARNEEENLKNNLSAILNQNYPDYEVIVVNDSSTDDSINILAEYKQKYPKLNYTNIDEIEDFYHGKKLGLTIGIKAAKNDILVLTDADCYPASEFWLQSIVNNFNEETEIIIGYGGYETRKGLLNKLIQFDTLSIAMQYLGLAKLGYPYMGVGRNLAYRKSSFMKNRGFASHAHILSGDDDLFINEIATKKNTEIEISANSFTMSKPKESFKNWLKQKSRHLSTGKYYKFGDKVRLGLEIFSRLLFYFSFILLIVLNFYIAWVLAIFSIRMISQLIIFKLFMNKLKIKKILFFSPFFDMLIPLINLYLLITNYLTLRNVKWM